MNILKTITFMGIISFLTLAIGILVKVIGFPDQIRKNYTRKSTSGLSTYFIILSFVSYFLWTIHGIMIKDKVVIIGQGLGIITTGIILLQISIYKKNKN